MIKQILIVIALMNISSNAVAQKIDEKKNLWVPGIWSSILMPQ